MLEGPNQCRRLQWDASCGGRSFVYASVQLQRSAISCAKVSCAGGASSGWSTTHVCGGFGGKEFERQVVRLHGGVLAIRNRCPVKYHMPAKMTCANRQRHDFEQLEVVVRRESGEDGVWVRNTTWVGKCGCRRFVPRSGRQGLHARNDITFLPNARSISGSAMVQRSDNRF